MELMIKQGIMESENRYGLPPGSHEMQQTTYDAMIKMGEVEGGSHSFEGRIYAENPYKDLFHPRACFFGRIQPKLAPNRQLGELLSISLLVIHLLRTTKIETGMTITTLTRQSGVTGDSRAVAIERLYSLWTSAVCWAHHRMLITSRILLPKRRFMTGK